MAALDPLQPSPSLPLSALPTAELETTDAAERYDGWDGNDEFLAMLFRIHMRCAQVVSLLAVVVIAFLAPTYLGIAISGALLCLLLGSLAQRYSGSTIERVGELLRPTL
jgi:hypothetical protein